MSWSVTRSYNGLAAIPKTMITITLERFESTDQGTFGVLLGCPKVFTGELPWRDNARDVSCIPVGQYRAVWTFSPKFRRFTYMLHDVPERGVIRIHPANFMGDEAQGFKSELDGCIALGNSFVKKAKQKHLLDSAVAVREFENWLKERPFILEVTEAFLGPRLVRESESTVVV